MGVVSQLPNASVLLSHNSELLLNPLSLAAGEGRELAASLAVLTCSL